MNSEATQFEMSEASAPNVVVVYEDADTGIRAKHSLERLCNCHWPEPAAAARFWRSDLLTEHLLHMQAVADARDAHLILLSLRDGAQLPATVSAWLNSWVQHKEDRPYALGLLLDPPSQGNVVPAAVTDLQRLAATVGADFFHGFGEVPAFPRS